MLESSHQTLFQQCSAPKSLSYLLHTPGTTGPGPLGLTGQQASKDHQLRKEHTAHLSSAGWHGAISGEKWHRPHSLLPPCTVPGFPTMSLPVHLEQAGFTASLGQVKSESVSLLTEEIQELSRDQLLAALGRFVELLYGNLPL